MELDDQSFDFSFKCLQNLIKNENCIESYSSKFSTLKKDSDKVEMAYCLFSESNLLPLKLKIHPKSTEESNNFREKGNREYLLKKDLLAVQTYSVSAAFAPRDSEELALAFANRSAATFSLKEYKSSIEDIDRALKGKYPQELRYKLLERKGKCFKLMGMISSAQEVFQLALHSLNCSKLDEDKTKLWTQSLSNQLKSCSGKDATLEKVRECLPSIFNKNESILSASTSLQLSFSEELGRHLVAAANIEPGEVLVVEEPFASVLLPNAYNSHCFHCKKRCHSLIPCEYCVVAMYCSETCYSESWNDNHKIECTLVPLLVALDFTKIEFIAVRTLLMATKQYKSLNGLLQAIQQIESNGDVKTKGFDDSGCYDSANYVSVHHLVGNAELRSNADVFRRASAAAYILHLLDKNTSFFSSLSGANVHEENLESCLKKKKLSHDKFLIGGLLLKYFMIVPSNAHEISEMIIRHVEGGMDCESVEIGGALYPVLSLINHSCDPNVVRHSHNGDVNVLTAIQAIAAGEQIFDNYGYHHAMHDLDTRQSKLWSQYHFRCQCRACLENWPVYAQLPSTNPVYLNPRLKEEAEKSSEIFHEILGEIKAGNMEKKLGFLYAHLALLHRTIGRPWKEYSECQEAIKQCLSYKANHYVAH